MEQGLEGEPSLQRCAGLGGTDGSLIIVRRRGRGRAAAPRLVSSRAKRTAAEPREARGRRG
jgi:hypothetical protein